MSKAEKKYWVVDIENENIGGNSSPANLRRNIKRVGFLCIIDNGIEYKVFSAELGYILFSDKLLVEVDDRNSKEYINGREFIDAFIDGYKQGANFFKSQYTISPSAIYGENAELFVRDIHDWCCHKRLPNGQVGWYFVKSSFPYIISNSIIFDYGYYSGIVNEVGNLVKKYSNIFIAFDKCTHDTAIKDSTFKSELEKFGFYQLPKVNSLSPDKRKELTLLLEKSNFPFKIAMFDFLGFCSHLDSICKVKYKANIILSQLGNPNAKDGTAARHLRSSLLKPNQRYNAQAYKDIVEKEYHKLI